jgi:hypothetical protein
MLSTLHKIVKNSMKYKYGSAFLLGLVQENKSELTIWIPK